MPKFKYTAVDARGKQTEGVIEAVDQNDATSQIKQLGYFPTKLVEVTSQNTSEGKSKKVKGKTVKTKVLTVFTRQLATLIDAGLPLTRSLKTLQKQERNPVMKSTLESLSEAVESGGTFSEALTQHPKIFNKLYINMVRAGELGGVLEVVLNRLAEFQEKSQKIKSKVISAMIYPIVVLSIALLILTFMLIFIVPQFQKIFNDVLPGKPLPTLTQYVVDASNFIVDIYHWPFLLGGTALIIFGYTAFARTPFGSYFLDRLLLRIPVFGDLALKTGVARFSRTLGTLISSGVPILQALNITRDTADNQIVAQSINKIHDSVKEGESFIAPMESAGVFPPMVISMVQVGEETGQLPDMLVKVADVYEGEIDNAVVALTSILEPIMIVMLAVIVGTIVVALFLPMIGIMQGVSNQV